ncbi:MAG: Methyltransferase domain-containing protein [Nitrospira sp.]|nr:MAG: Methyltransferase domain-containing protein [Nitrospira sp.]
MPQNEPITVLVVNEQADDIKLVTLSLRSFFPDCRVESVYSSEEALRWVSHAEWDLILIDEPLGLQTRPSLVATFRERLPTTAIVILTDRSDPTAAVTALQAGANFILFKKSPAFLTELVLYTKGAVEQRHLRAMFVRTRDRHTHLLDTLTDIFYEIDATGRFLFISPGITALLGYQPEELTGVPFSKLIPADQQTCAQYRIDDRRTGPRAARRVLLELLKKPQLTDSDQARVRTEISAKGLYDARQHYTGTLGLIRDMTGHLVQTETIQRLETRLLESDRHRTMAQRLSNLSHELHTPLSEVLTQSQRLMETIRDAQLETRLDALTAHAREASACRDALAQAVVDASLAEDTLRHIMTDALTPIAHLDIAQHHDTTDILDVGNSRTIWVRIIQIVVIQAIRQMAARHAMHRLNIFAQTITATRISIDQAPSFFPEPTLREVEILIQETDSAAAITTDSLPASPDLIQAYKDLNQLQGRMEWLAPARQPLSVRLWLPIPEKPRVPDAPTEALLGQPELPLPATSAIPHETPLPPLSDRLLPDRRLATRAAVHLSARVTVGPSVREGIVHTLSLIGATVSLTGPLPNLSEQSAYLVFKTIVGILELHATVHDRSGTQTEPSTDAGNHSVLAFEFSPSSEIEQKVLGSFIEAAQKRNLEISLEALLSQPDESTRPDQTGSDRLSNDHRESIRVRIALPIRIEQSHEQNPASRQLGLAVNFSRGGACLQAKTLPGHVGETIRLHFPHSHDLTHASPHEPAAPDAVLPAQIVWTALDTTVPSELRPAPTEPGQRFGVRFDELPAFAEREVNRVVAQHIGSSIELDGIASRAVIVSARRECRNARGQVIAITDDHARHQISPNTPIVILSPGFGGTQTDYVALSEFLALNRLRVLRYDYSNHIGQSDGDVLQTTLRGMQADLRTVLEFAHTTWPTASLAILAEDVAARVALKVVTQHPAAHLLLLANPVLDIQTALSTGHHHDLLADYRHGLRRGSGNLWGLNINLDQFLGNTIAGHYDTLATTVADLSALTIPLVILNSPSADSSMRHPFPSPDKSLRALRAMPRTISIPSALSVTGRTFDTRFIASFHTLFTEIARVCAAGDSPPAMHTPTGHDISKQYLLERERIRIRHHVSQSTRDALWIAHLAQLPQLDTLHHHVRLLQDLYQQALPLEPGMRILDIGCGEGAFAHTLVVNRMYHQLHASHAPQRPIQYLGIDRSQETISSAEQAFTALYQELQSMFPTAAVPATAVTAEWDIRLPTTPDSADRIVSHLSLSFAASPLTFLRQAVRTLTQEGHLIVTCLQPHTDLAGLYREQLHRAGQDELSPAAQIFLHYLGRLHEAIRHGLLHSFDREQLSDLLTHAGATPLRIVPVLDGQLLLATASKGKSAG